MGRSILAVLLATILAICCLAAAIQGGGGGGTIESTRAAWSHSSANQLSLRWGANWIQSAAAWHCCHVLWALVITQWMHCSITYETCRRFSLDWPTDRSPNGIRLGGLVVRYPDSPNVRCIVKYDLCCFCLIFQQKQRQKLWKLVESQQSYCNNKKAGCRFLEDSVCLICSTHLLHVQRLAVYLLRDIFITVCLSVLVLLTQVSLY